MKGTLFAKPSLSMASILEMIYIGLLTFVLTSFLMVPIPAFALIFLFQLPFHFWIRKKVHFLLSSVGYLLLCGAIGIYLSMIVQLIITGVLCLLLLFFIHYFDKDKSISKYQQSIFTVLLPFCIVFIVEYMQRNAIDAFRYLFLSYQLPDSHVSFHLAFCITIVFLWTLYFLLTLFFQKKRTAVFITALPAFLLGTTHMVVLHLTSSPLQPSDIFIFTTAMDVIGEQKITLELVLLAGSSFLFMGGFFFLVNKVYQGAINSKKRRMVQGLLSTFSILLLYFAIGGIETLNFHSNYRYGFLYYFMQEAQSELPEPDGYAPITIDTSLSDASNASKKNPNVIIVMSEAFSDFTTTYGLETSEDPIPYFHALQETWPSGTVYSSVFGNNTVSSEFECLTGISTGFTTKGSNVYQRYMKEDFYSLGDYYSKLGYETGVFHACAGNNYNRLKVYEMMHYDKRLFLEDLPEDTEKVRSFVSDKANFNKVSELIQTTDEPLFLMNITMQNHASYDKEFDIEPYVSLKNNQEQHKDVERYLSLLRKSDDDLKAFLEELSSSPEPTVVLFFGDHQPMVSKDFYSEQIGTEFTEFSLEEKAITYQVPYLLWSNFETGSSFAAPKVTSMNYLSLLLNSFVGNPDTEWFSLLRELQEYYPVITENFVMDSAGVITNMEEIKTLLSSSDEESTPTALLKKYQFACYSFFDE